MRLAPSAVLLALFLGACAAPSLDLMPRYGRFSVEGEALVGSAGTSGQVDLEEAGLEEDDTLHGRVDLKFGAPHLILSGVGPKFEGTGTLSAAIDDGTNTIPAGTTVDSQFDLGLYDGLIVFDMIPGDTFEFALGVGGNVLDLELAFEDVGTGTTVETAETFVVPVLAALGAVQWGPLELQVLGSGFNASYQNDSILYWTGDAFLRLRFLGGDEHLRASLVGGYRISEFEVEYDDEDSDTDVDIDLQLQGPYVGFELTF